MAITCCFNFVPSRWFYSNRTNINNLDTFHICHFLALFKMLKNKFKLENGIKTFNIDDPTALEVKKFYKDDPFPNYELSDNKLSISSKGDKNQFTYNLKKFIGYGKKVLEVGAGTCQLSNYLAIGNSNPVVAFDMNYESLKIGSEFSKKK